MDSTKKFATWEEEMYWKNFHFAHFSLMLPSDFHQLTLPKKFTDYMRSKLPENVVLKINGLTWDVKLEKVKDEVMFKGHGWQEFVKAYSLKEEDMIVFKYIRNECFELLLFDTANLCEIEASYFVRKPHESKCNNNNVNSNGEQREILSEFTERTTEEPDQESDVAPRNKLRKRDCFAKSAIARAIIYDSDDSEREETDQRRKSNANRHCTPERTPSLNGNEVPSKSLTTRKRDINKTVNVQEKIVPKGYQAGYYKSNRRDVTEEEKLETFLMAQKKSREYKNSFLVVMRPTCVYKRFFMTIPQEWRPRIALKKDQKLILQIKDKKWECTYNSGVQGGWKRFATENCLEEFDVCLFVPAEPKDGKYVLDVHIFRVVPEVVKPTLLTPK